MPREEPIHVVDLLADERAWLIERLSVLSAADLDRPTNCGDWTVKDIALHLLGADLSVLSRLRDGFTPPPAPGHDLTHWDGFVAFLNDLHETWLAAARRLSTPLLCRLLRVSGAETEAYFRSLDPLVPHVPVEWAGPEPAPAWLTIAREYTERWVHHQDILDAVGQTDPRLNSSRFLGPVLATFVQGLPHTLRNTPAPPGTRLRLTISGAAGGRWLAVRDTSGWRLTPDDERPVDAATTLDPETAWRVFTRRIDPATARSRARLAGDSALAAEALQLFSLIM